MDLLAFSFITDAHDLCARRSFALLTKAFGFERKQEMLRIVASALNRAKSNDELLANMKPVVKG